LPSHIYLCDAEAGPTPIHHHAFGGDPRLRLADCQKIITNHDLPPPRLPA
jgi:hypothetical protein